MFWLKEFRSHKVAMEKLFKEREEATEWITSSWIANKKESAKLECHFHNEHENKMVAIAKLQATLEYLEVQKESYTKHLNVKIEEQDSQIKFLVKQNEELLKQLRDVASKLAEKQITTTVTNN